MYKNGRVEIIANDQGNRITPSYVAFTPEGERLIGDAAKNQLTSNPENTVFDAKRLIGRNWKDSSVQHDIKYFPFSTIDKNNKPHIRVNVRGEQKLFAAEEISAMVLVKMKVSFENNCHDVIMMSSHKSPLSCGYDYTTSCCYHHFLLHRKQPRLTWATQSPMQLSLSLPTSMMLSDRRPRMPVSSLVYR